MKNVFPFLLFLVFNISAIATTLEKDSTKRNSLKGFPVLFYAPETRIGFGAAGVFSFLNKKDTLNNFPSSLTLMLAYTQNKQIIVDLPYNLYIKNRKYWAYGSVGYYDFYYYFFGIGNNVSSNFKEYYSASFKRIRLSFLKRFSKTKFLYAGIKYAYDNIEITANDTSGIIYEKNITGSKGGNVSGIGAVFNFDNRNHVFYPTKGNLIEAFVYTEKSFTGSSFDYTRFTIDASHFENIGKKQVLAFNFYGVNIIGEVPFTHLGMLGGMKKMRGYYEGRFRDKTAFCLQTEWRLTLLKNWGINVFGSTGAVAPTMKYIAVNNLKFTAGAGIRYKLDKKQHINLRADFAVGKNSSGFYFTIGEAF